MYMYWEVLTKRKKKSLSFSDSRKKDLYTIEGNFKEGLSTLTTCCLYLLTKLWTHSSTYSGVPDNCLDFYP
jgi:hypothetical protein